MDERKKKHCTTREITQQLCLLNALREVLKKDVTERYRLNNCNAKTDSDNDG